MEDKRTESYTAIFRYLRDDLNITFKDVMTDFEQGMKNALLTVFPGIKLYSCWFHYGQAICRKLQTVPKSVRFRFDVKEQVAKLIALPLLPSNKIELAYQMIKSNVITAKNNYYSHFVGFFIYFESFWLRKIGVKNFSVYGLSRRTNNNSEIFNAQFNAFIGVKHPNIWVFLGRRNYY